MEAEVAVVGAGPTGLLAAGEVAKAGLDVVVFEEHGQVGVPVHCAGLLSLKGLRALGFREDEDFVLNTFRGAILYSPSGFELRIEAKRPLACVVDRRALDVELASRAESEGARLLLGKQVKHISARGARVFLRGPWGSMSCRASVVAEGFKSRLVRVLGLRTINWRAVLPASQVEVKAPGLEEDFVEIHLSSRVAPGFFAWVIPLGDGKARVGLACRGLDPRKALRSFLKRRFGLAVDRAPYSGSVLKCGPIPKTYSGMVAVVGDAAGQAKPTTGGGVVLGGICAILAGREVVRALEEGRGSLASYELAWRKALWPDFKAMLALRKMLDAMPDRLVDTAVLLADESALSEMAEEELDMDRQSTFLRALPRYLFACLFGLARRALSFLKRF